MLLSSMQRCLACDVRGDTLERWHRIERDVGWMAHASERNEEQAHGPFIIARIDDHTIQREALRLVDAAQREIERGPHVSATTVGVSKLSSPFVGRAYVTAQASIRGNCSRVLILPESQTSAVHLETATIASSFMSMPCTEGWSASRNDGPE